MREARSRGVRRRGESLKPAEARGAEHAPGNLIWPPSNPQAEFGAKTKGACRTAGAAQLNRFESAPNPKS
jgi:hypothetical protein